MERRERQKQLEEIRKYCRHCVDLGLFGTVHHCAILMALTGLSNRQTHCRPVPALGHDDFCETDLVRGAETEKTTVYKNLMEGVSLLDRN